MILVEIIQDNQGRYFKDLKKGYYLMVEKIDLLKQLKHLYHPGKDPSVVDVPAMNFLMIDGHGDPNHAIEYQEAMEGLFSLAYTIKFDYKRAEGNDYGVLPAEGLWWVDDMSLFSIEDKSDWYWTMMIAQPDFITQEWVERGRKKALQKKKDCAALEKIRFESYAEGLSVQLMHSGQFAEEGPNIARLHDYIKMQGCELRGKHHEIYLSDFRRTAPEKLKTIIRQPMQAV
jgi:hypothetical protein